MVNETMACQIIIVNYNYQLVFVLQTVLTTGGYSLPRPGNVFVTGDVNECESMIKKDERARNREDKASPLLIIQNLLLAETLSSLDSVVCS